MMKPLLNDIELQETIQALSRSILKRHHPFKNIVLVGIQTRGVLLAERLKEDLTASQNLEGEIPLGILDISFYRDDLSLVAEAPVVKKTDMPISLQDQGVILVDDVLFTGRTVRAALDALLDFGRPRFIELAVLVDRGGRELPIQANYVGIHYEAVLGDNVKVMFQESDGDEKVVVI